MANLRHLFDVRASETNYERKGGYIIVKIWLNEAPIPTFRAVPVAIVTAPHAEPTDTIDLADFNKLIYELNAARASSSNIL